MKITKVKISELKQAEYNPRRMTNKQYEDLKNSLEKFGCTIPIVINADSTIVGGHQRVRIMRELGAEFVPAVRVNLSKEDERELNIRLNKNTGEFDLDILANNFDIDELKDWGFKDVELGFNIDKIVEGNIEDDHIPEVKESRVKLGDVWQLGKHRLMCGDSTKESDVNKLMNGDKADMVFTDPPYGVSYTGGVIHGNKINKNHKREMLKNDEVNIYSKFIKLIPLIIDEGAIYIFYATKFSYEIYKPLKENNIDVMSVLAWIKINTGYADMNSHYKNRYEPFVYCKAGSKTNFIGDTTENTTWEIKKERINKLHPTQKPTELCVRAIKNHKADIVADLFLGSGATLIACEKTNRTCYGMELDTKYCDVIIERWEQFTGQKAKKI